MALKRIDLGSLTDSGEDHSVPSTQAKWVKLENVVFRNGAIVNRPGFRNSLRG